MDKSSKPDPDTRHPADKPPTTPDDFEDAIRRLRAEHSVSLGRHPGSTRWSCSCGAGSSGSGAYRTEAQTRAASERHLRAELRKILGSS